MRRPRIAVAAKLALVLCGIAALATGLALIFQERALSADLHEAARERLSRSALAVEQLVESHLEALLDRYRAISATPELRANLETNHAPTLIYHAERLAGEQGASLLFFVEHETRWIAPAGDVSLAPAALARLEGSDPTNEFASLVAHDGQASAMVAVPLRTGRHHIGRLSPDAMVELYKSEPDHARLVDHIGGRHRYLPDVRPVHLIDVAVDLPIVLDEARLHLEHKVELMGDHVVLI